MLSSFTVNADTFACIASCQPFQLRTFFFSVIVIVIGLSVNGPLYTGQSVDKMNTVHWSHLGSHSVQYDKEFTGCNDRHGHYNRDGWSSVTDRICKFL